MSSNPDLPIEFLPELMLTLEHEIQQTKQQLHKIQTQATPSTQPEAAQLLQAHQELEHHLEQVVELEAQHHTWQAFNISNKAAELLRFAELVKSQKRLLNTCLKLSNQHLLEAQKTTGFQGFDEAWRDPKTRLMNHPIAHLPLFDFFIQGQLNDALELMESLTVALLKPHSLDDATLDRVDHNYTVSVKESLTMHGWQLERWLEQTLTHEQKLEIQRLRGVLEQYRLKALEVLALSKRIRAGSINRIMEKDDLQLGLEFLLGELGKQSKDG